MKKFFCSPVFLILVLAAPTQAIADPHQCPSGFELVPAPERSSCLHEDLTLPETTIYPYCHYLDYGYLGYSFEGQNPNPCPPHTRFASNGANSGFCLYEGISLPNAEVQADCLAVADGTIGNNEGLGCSNRTGCMACYSCKNRLSCSTQGSNLLEEAYVECQ